MNRSDRNLRLPPAYQEYPGDIMKTEAYMRMSSSALGLAWRMRKLCWGHNLPHDMELLAKLLHWDLAELERDFPQTLAAYGGERPMFAITDGRVHCTELDEQWENVMAGRELMSEGGKRGAAAKAERKGTPEPTPKGTRKGRSRDERDERDEMNRAEESFDSGISREGCARESKEPANDYERASRGS
jgi:hypothetical protein